MSSGWWRGVGLCLQFAISIVFSGCLWNFAYQIREQYLADVSGGSPNTAKLIAIITVSAARKSGKWYSYFKGTYVIYMLSSSLSVLLIEIAFLFIHGASHTRTLEIHAFCASLYAFLRAAHTLLTSSLESFLYILSLFSLFTPTHTLTCTVLNAHTLIHFRLYPCSLSCSSAEHSSTLIKAVYLHRCSSFPSHAA